MKRFLLAIPAALLLAGTPFSRPKPITPHRAFPVVSHTIADDNEKKEGWEPLFDGKTTKGWHRYGKTKPELQWEVVDGALHLNKSKGGKGDLVTDKEFSDFDLKLEWKISPKGNSGVIFYVHEDPVKYPEPYQTGPEMQVLDNDGHPDGKIHKHRAGDLYDLIASTKDAAKPVGEWNEVEIRSKNGELKLFLNGVNTVSTTVWDDNWKKLIAGSKFKQWPDFGTFRTGKIDLQDHGNEVWYRNIRIRKL